MNLLNLSVYARGYIRHKKLPGIPIVVGGCERSGTTLLQSMLSAHPNLYAFEEEIWSFCYGKPAGFDSKRPIRMSRLYKHLGQDPLPETAVRWCEKSPANIFFFKDILEHFNRKVKLIQIVRDGRDVISSMHPQNHKEPWVPSKRWRAAIEAGLPYRNHPNVTTVRYEDLIQNYDQTMRSICNFIEEDFHQNMAAWHEHSRIKKSRNLLSSNITPIHSGSIKKFEQLDFPHRQRIDDFQAIPEISKLLKAYDYI
ncbi:MAG: sulfotransferase [Pseudomonadales bacterium]